MSPLCTGIWINVIQVVWLTWKSRDGNGMKAFTAFKGCPQISYNLPVSLGKISYFLCQSSPNPKKADMMIFFFLSCFITTILSIQVSRQRLSFPMDVHIQRSCFCSSHESRSSKSLFLKEGFLWVHLSGCTKGSLFLPETEFQGLCRLTLVH